ncbi:aspartyl-tRNA synthetase [Capronia coronata CBS 617.96]|uniref:Aspartyl-tRNA synthetase n=1 Tax=Capronia coronata CBS 617.96 TaxID=1182541 RepID=W9Z1P3_9EURO|nr:aspartyl-tRNA synthetase [Capronia coronata CBS 617.96]EXJ95845.1 aspartyl-tRNA synthetase [Capronia coronata CBS 617.96]
MTLRSPAARLSHLRDSYIEISRYVRSQSLSHTPRPRTVPSRPVLSRRHASAAATADVNRLNSATADLRQSHTTNLKAARPTTLSKQQQDCLERFERNSLNSDSLTTWDSLLGAEPGDGSGTNGGHGTRVAVLGYITSQRSAKQCEFFQLVDPRLELAIQVVLPTTASKTADVVNEGGVQILPDTISQSSRDNASDQNTKSPMHVQAHTPVQIVGSIVGRKVPPKQARSSKQEAEVQDGHKKQENSARKTVQKLDPFVGMIDLVSHVEIRADFITPLNSFPSDTIAAWDTAFPPEMRHLQFRTDHELRKRIRLRSKVSASIRQHMLGSGFDEIETPLLFKSTPEGAREFVVPTRKRGMAYALPQSPQQYKQVLMASGISRYFQFARCFRDEDLRADRQPEFTQLDLEMSFAGATQVMRAVEQVLLKAVWPSVQACDAEADSLALPRLTYNEVMARYGSDKPDTRIGAEICRIDDWLAADAKGMLTSLADPIVEIIKIDMQGCSPSQSGHFIRSFLDAPSASAYFNNPDGIPGVSVYDTGRPLSGLSSFGHEGATRVEEHFEPEPGDIFLTQARVNAPFTGGSTMLGNLRRDVHQSAVSQGLLPPPAGFSALWVTDFPLFSPTVQSEPGQGGLAGICSTHHPFTAPKPGQDLSRLISDPLSVVGDHYDLVINGVEVGGGSRRIHDAEMQELIFRDVLKMKPERVEDFRHLLNALKSGCPPHAGFALGFDRLMAMLTDRVSVRDVIAFPKHTDGQDRFVGSPSELTEEQLATYHLAVVDRTAENTRPQISLKA